MRKGKDVWGDFLGRAFAKRWFFTVWRLMSKYKPMPGAFKGLYESLMYVSFSWWSPESRHVHFLGETTLPSTRVYSIRTQQTGIVHNIWVIQSWITLSVGHPHFNLRLATPNLGPFHSCFHATFTVVMTMSQVLLAQCVGQLLCTASNILGLIVLS